jgi:hypothetical protein
MNAGTGIEIKQEGLGHALSDNTLRVPVYQRSYMWEDENVTTLFGDLANAIADNSPDYFLGSVVVTKGSNGSPEVVDGQQRLATITIFIAAIRDYFLAQNEKELADDIEREYLMTRGLRTREITPNLHLNEYDHDYFFKRVLSRLVQGLPNGPKRPEKNCSKIRIEILMLPPRLPRNRLTQSFGCPTRMRIGQRGFTIGSTTSEIVPVSFG